MAQRNDHSREQLREMSLAAAEAILASEGAGALSVRRIAQSIGYSHGTLYLIFRNFDGLLLELNGRTLDSLTAALDAALGAALAERPRGPEALHALARAYLDFARRHTARFRLVFEHHLPEEEETPDWLMEKIAHGHGLLDAALAAGGAGEDGRETMGVALWSAIHGVTVLALDQKLISTQGVELDPEPVLARTVDAFLAATR